MIYHTLTHLNRFNHLHVSVPIVKSGFEIQKYKVFIINLNLPLFRCTHTH